MLGEAPIRAAVRTGDTPQSERARMRRTPPHILVTTPESLYILLSTESGRNMLRTVRTVIVDEIHALAGNKRGAHLALSLERLEALCEQPPTRVGISATTKPIEVLTRFLTGVTDAPCTVIDEGHARERDLTLELPGSPLEAIMSAEVWVEQYDRLAELIRAHRTTLVFVNTRRLAERAARHLAERLGEDAVTSHHGSLAKEHRLKAEERLKAGQLKALVATASLELGIDIGDVDLVCQLGSPHAIAAFLQRVGRSGHGLGACRKGACSRCRATISSSARRCSRASAGASSTRSSRGRSRSTCSRSRSSPRSACRNGRSRICTSASRTRRATGTCTLDEFVGVARMVADGFTTHRGRRSAHLHFDRVNNVLRGRRGAALTAVTNGGAIPDQFDYEVVLLPSELPVGTLNEDFAFESMPGDVFQLGNASYRIQKVESGKVYVADAHGQPPTIPFWLGEAPGRSDELSSSVGALNETIAELLDRDGRRRRDALAHERARLERERGEAARRLLGRREGGARRAADDEARHLRAVLRRDGRHASRRAFAVRLAHQSRLGLDACASASAGASTSSCRPRRSRTRSCCRSAPCTASRSRTSCTICRARRCATC